MAKKLTTTVRLTEEARQLLDALSTQHGLSHTAILETAVREKARRDKTALPALAPDRARRQAVGHA